MKKDSFSSSFSVLMAVYRGDDPFLLEKAILSISKQTLKPQKFLIVCDGQLTSELDQILEKFKYLGDICLEIIRLKENCGLAVALNEGLKKVDTEWVARADADDINRPNRFEITQSLIRQYPQIVLIGGAIQERSKLGKKMSIKRVPISHSEILKFAKKRNPFNHMTTAFRTEVVKELGGYPNLYLREDYGLWIKILAAGYTTRNSDQILVDATTDAELYKRRGGWSYAKAELDMQKYLINHGLKGHFLGFVQGFARALVFIAPKTLRQLIYQKLLRK